jgi:hypothetical protein
MADPAPNTIRIIAALHQDPTVLDLLSTLAEKLPCSTRKLHNTDAL